MLVCVPRGLPHAACERFKARVETPLEELGTLWRGVCSRSAWYPIEPAALQPLISPEPTNSCPLLPQDGQFGGVADLEHAVLYPLDPKPTLSWRSATPGTASSAAWRTWSTRCERTRRCTTSCRPRGPTSASASGSLAPASSTRRAALLASDKLPLSVGGSGTVEEGIRVPQSLPVLLSHHPLGALQVSRQGNLGRFRA